MDLQFFSGDTCVPVEIVPPLSDVYLHHFYLGFEPIILVGLVVVDLEDFG
jgi:hypothetical protein